MGNQKGQHCKYSRGRSVVVAAQFVPIQMEISDFEPTPRGRTEEEEESGVMRKMVGGRWWSAGWFFKDKL